MGACNLPLAFGNAASFQVPASISLLLLRLGSDDHLAELCNRERQARRAPHDSNERVSCLVLIV